MRFNWRQIAGKKTARPGTAGRTWMPLQQGIVLRYQPILMGFGGRTGEVIGEMSVKSSRRISGTFCERDHSCPEPFPRRLAAFLRPSSTQEKRAGESGHAGFASHLPTPALSQFREGSQEGKGGSTGRGSHRRSPVRQCFRGRLLLLAVTCAALVVACGAPHDYGYDYALKASGEPAAGVVENDRLRVQVVPTAVLGVVHVAVTNKSLKPVAVAWEETYFVNPHGHRHQAVDRDQAVIRAPDASMSEGGIAPGATWRGTVQPGGAPATSRRQTESSRYQGDLSPVDRQLVLNPLTVTVYEGGEVALGSAVSSFLPNAGDAPELAEAYRDQEFQFVLGLRAGDDVTPYRFDFVITDVQVR